MNKKIIRDGLEILPLLIFIVFTKFLPLRTKSVLGGIWFGWILRSSSKLKKRVTDNLRIAMPQLTEDEKIDFLRDFGNLTGKTFVELIFNSEFQKKEHRFEYLEEDLSPLILAKKIGRPIIIVSAHLGPWEAVRAVLKKHNLTAGAIYKKNKNRFYEPLHLTAIKSGGNPIFSTGLSGTKKMISYLRSGGIVAIMLDQADDSGEFFDFLGAPAKTSTSIAKIAIKLNALVVPAYAVRNSTNDNISVFFEKAIVSNNYFDMTAKINSSIEKRVYSNPTQWYWLHRRWKY